jgi:16S rRNA C1402 (ribose-2'-O) methylase RsmI
MIDMPIQVWSMEYEVENVARPNMFMDTILPRKGHTTKATTQRVKKHIGEDVNEKLCTSWTMPVVSDPGIDLVPRACSVYLGPRQLTIR